MKYDYVIVGAGLFGATFCYLMKNAGKKCLVIDQRPHIGGNLYCKTVNGIPVHWYGPHVFHTDSKEVYDFVTGLVDVHTFFNQPLAKFDNELFSLPFNMNTFGQLWGVRTASQAKARIESQKPALLSAPINLEEYAIHSVGREIYEKFIKGYTEKQWGRPCKSLPCSIIKRIPIRFTYDNTYFSDRYQFIPNGAYMPFISKLLEGSRVLKRVSYKQIKDSWHTFACRMLYTGRLDSFFDYRYGVLGYRSLRFFHKELLIDDYQSNAVVNYTDKAVPFTRIIEHKHFDQSIKADATVITREFPNGLAGKDDYNAYYPINDIDNDR